MERNSKTKQLHNCLLLIFNEIRKVCDDNKIKYFFIGGSLLGAVRHKGFIPWDDDLDIGILRKDYDRLVDLLMANLNTNYFISSVFNENNYGLPYIKVRLKNTFFYESGVPKENNLGIFVDVFPIDKIPSCRMEQKIHNLFLEYYKFRLLDFCGYEYKHSLKNMVISILPNKKNKSIIYNNLLFWQTKYNSTGYMYANLCSSYKYGKEIFPVECIEEEPDLLQFENVIVKCPHNPEKVLSYLYGNFMQLPPEEKRIFRHSVSDIDFGTYISEYQNNSP